MIVITESHRRFWASRHMPGALRAGMKPFDINELIPAGTRRQLDLSMDAWLEVSNTLTLIKNMHRRMSIESVLRHLMESPYSSKRRRGLCAKWLGRIQRDRRNR